MRVASPTFGNILPSGSNFARNEKPRPQKWAGALRRFLGFCPRRSRGPSLLCELRECRSILHRKIGQNFAVELDPSNLQTMNQLAVGQPVEPGSSADTLNPKLTVLALLDAT